MGLLDYERRRASAHGVEVAATSAALGAGAGLAAERVRDRYKQDRPRSLRRVAARAGPLEHAVLHARVPPTVVAAGTLAAGIGYGAQKYQDKLAATELKNTRRQAREAKHKLRRHQDRQHGTIAARAPQEVIDMETGILAKAAPRHYRVERHRSQGEAAAATGGLIATGAAAHAQLSRSRHLRAAESARTVRRVSTGTGALSAAAGAAGASRAHSAYHTAASAHRAAHEFKVPDFVEEKHVPPKPPVSRRLKGESDQALASRRATDQQRFLDRARSAHEHEQNRLRAEHVARHSALKPAHDARIGQEARTAGRRAASLHGIGAAGGFIGATGSLGEGLKAHGEFRRATKLAARSARSVKSRGAAAIGLLGAAAALHESKNRRQPPRIPYA